MKEFGSVWNICLIFQLIRNTQNVGNIWHLPVWQWSLPSCEVVVSGAQAEHSASLLIAEVKVPLGQGVHALELESLKYPGTHSEMPNI